MIDQAELVGVVTVVDCVETDTKVGREGHNATDMEVGGTAGLSAISTK